MNNHTSDDGGGADSPSDQPDPDDAVNELTEEDLRRKQIQERAENEIVKREARRMADAMEATAGFPAARLVSRALTEELKRESVHDDPLINGYLPASGNVTIVGTKKVGKTTLIGNIAQSFADGVPFLGMYSVRQPGRIAIWNYEVNEDQYRDWLRDMGIKNTDMVEVLNLRGLNLQLASPYAREWTVKWLREHDIKIWIPDPGHRACSGWDPDSNTEVLAFTEHIDAMKAEAEVESVAMPLHTGNLRKDGSSELRARGAARWGDWPDALWTYVKGDLGKRGLSAEGRDVDMPEQTLSYDPATRMLSIAGGSLYSEKLKADQHEIVKWLTEHRDQHPTKTDGAGLMGIRKGDFLRSVNRLVEETKVVMVKDGNARRLYLPADVLPGQEVIEFD